MLRVAANLRQGDLAKKLNVTPNYLSSVENGKKEPSLTFLRNFSKSMEVSLGYLLWLALEKGELSEEKELKEKMDRLLVEIIRKKANDSNG